jgi:hypothetical protein
VIHAWGDPVAMFHLISSLVAAGACWLLFYRLFSTWDDLTRLTQLVTGTLAMGLLLGAVFTFELHFRESSMFLATGVPLFFFRVFAFSLGVTWHYWLAYSVRSRSTGVQKPVDNPAACG